VNGFDLKKNTSTLGGCLLCGSVRSQVAASSSSVLAGVSAVEIQQTKHFLQSLNEGKANVFRHESKQANKQPNKQANRHPHEQQTNTANKQTGALHINPGLPGSIAVKSMLD